MRRYTRDRLRYFWEPVLLIVAFPLIRGAFGLRVFAMVAAGWVLVRLALALRLRGGGR